ncbi:glyoxalase [Thiosulfatimonas sediminis]|uniref:Glyoxalase n=1 Tax=Thiosulfatimonas sediminis TaxID=2675054 RepID=A0A6F8PUU8_9GAMM|nr:VOC family protein [Thiosulfatimonas sediminis]BBP45889.1 glyoxalase [Thiosulfatimonas sediminis]
MPNLLQTVLGVDHVSVIVTDTQAACEFYQHALGLAVLDRPNLGFPGAWLDLGAGQTLHLLEVKRAHIDAQYLPEHGGRDFHFALKVKKIEPFVTNLERMGVAYNKSRSGRQALFFRDPDGNAIELSEVSA